MSGIDPLEITLDGDNIFTAARRVSRSVLIDDEHDGGLLSQKTVEANGLLARHLDVIDKALKAGDRVKITIQKEPDDV